MILFRLGMLRVIWIDFMWRVTREATHSLRPNIANERIENSVFSAVPYDFIGGIGFR